MWGEPTPGTAPVPQPASTGRGSSHPTPLIAYPIRVGDLLIFAVYALATARASRLIIHDEIVRDPRKWYNKRAPKGSLRAYWITCVWCVSILMATFPAVSWVLWPHHPAALIPCTIGAYSWLAVLATDAQRLLVGKANLYVPQTSDDEEA